MSNLMDYFFGPLSKEYCLYYYVMAVIAAIMFLMTLVSVIVGAFNVKKLTIKYFFMGLYALIPMFISYFLMRLMYTICIKAL